MTEAGGLLFPKPRLVVIGIIGRAEAFRFLLENLARSTDTQPGEIAGDRWAQFILKELAFKF